MHRGLPSVAPSLPRGGRSAAMLAAALASLVAAAYPAPGRAEASRWAPQPSAAEEPASICTANDTGEAKCYAGSEPAIYGRSRAVARLVIGGTLHCTGWLVGNEGHLLTAGHCVPNQAAADTTQVELGAEGADCATDCRQADACPGTVVATSVTLVRANPDLDYSLVRLPVNPTAEYGFLQLRAAGAALGERIYLPQLPGGFGKRIAVTSTYPADTGGFPHIVSDSEPACHAAADVPHLGSFADTQPGTSGSPLVAYADHRVIALHGCRALSLCSTGEEGSDSPNRALPIEALIADLGADLPLSALYDPLFADGFESGDVGAWAVVVP